MWLMLQQETLEEFVCYRCKRNWQRKNTGIVRVTVNEKYFRPTEVDLSINNPKKVEENLKWKPKMTFKKLVKEMVAADIELMRKDPTA
ncbi:unnamed protein product [Rotaria sordida]|uniref:GDP-mannose 4,6-dehydratase n=1 Tax=Rotaria sordida TaxID=392033 RepID=A0A813N1H3_9BILA|nr:unnamed protein product [Rotaria sordida]CAF0731407.1 unnamed protein product [Rotaria sordida]